ncbi:MAG: hypothetical protein M1546_26030 [Chloroflexi bacterium]|nr:hypothetical protein [Chloroflexota bacterium]
MAGLIVAAFVVVAIVVVPTRLVTGRWHSVRVFARSLPTIWQALTNRADVVHYSHSKFTNVVFLHHSVGQNMIEQGHVREAFTAAGYDFFDHGYNDQGLRMPSGAPAGYSYNVPESNTDPDGLAAVFSLPGLELPVNAFSGLLQHEVIVIKSCYWVNNIKDDAQLAAYQAYYRTIRDAMDHHRDKLFVIVTSPPVNPAGTNAAEAARARAFASWLKSAEFLDGHPNIVTFNLFEYLANNDPASADYSMLRSAYRDGDDSHPNRTANEQIGPQLADFVINAAQAYRSAYAGHANEPVASRP